MANVTEFEGWGAFDNDSIKGQLKRFSFTPKTWEETDVDIKVLYCGVCASDVSLMSSAWFEQDFPTVCGHEVVGEVIRVGSKVKHLKVGDIAGVGAQAESCLKCDECLAGEEVYCVNGHTPSCGAKYVYGPAKGEKTSGGFADTKRSPAHFAFKIPDGLDPAMAAPMLCGGITMYSPLAQYGAGTKAKNVGIIGIGGLGHFGILLAKAMGATVTAISHSENKKADALEMGADHFIATHEAAEEAFAPHKRSLDLIICTVNDASMPLTGYLSLLKRNGNLILVGVPHEPLPVPVFPLIGGNVHIGGSAIGNAREINEMFKLVAEKGVKPWINKRPMDDINSVIPDMVANKARYRLVLCHEANGAKLD
ncbi:hypothetical protein JCM8547_004852 [Rhodosporidiobolus lusitaniae]